jgi:myo-inositol 2-dehydrogenase / D-chiro-inositol 1-dehydrogenase
MPALGAARTRRGGQLVARHGLRVVACGVGGGKTSGYVRGSSQVAGLTTGRPVTRLGVIGLGRIGAFHTGTLNGLDGVDGLVVTDQRPELVAAVAAKYGATPVDSVDELLSSGIHGVIVATCTQAHASLTLAAVERGLPTFCEKPIAASAAESARVAETIAASGVPVQVGYQRRFDPAFAAAKRAADDGSLGWLHTVRSTTLDPAPPPFEYLTGSGGIFRDCLVHDFDVLRWITGDRAVEVYATGTVHSDHRFTEIGDVDTATAIVTFEHGTLGVASAARFNGRGYDCRLEAHGSDDSVVAGWDQGSPMRNMDPRNDFPAGPAHRFFMDRFADAFRAELAAFVDVTIGRAAPPCTASDAVEAAWIAETAAESARRHAPVRVDEVTSR